MNKIHRFSRGEELANTLSHAVGAVFGLTALVLMAVFASLKGDAWHVVSLSIYGSTLFLLFLSSTINHGLPHGRLKDFFHNFDQVAIYLLIAGTYTPIALVPMKYDWGWVMFGLQWFLALCGIVFKTLVPNKYERGVNYFTMFSFILMGWMLLFFLLPLFRTLPLPAMVLILAGGLSYSLGTIFYRMRSVPYHHLVWHIFVLAGSVAHFIAIFGYLIPWGE
jgi:hemolysin III